VNKIPDDKYSEILQVPPLPAVAQRLIYEAGREDINIHELATIIQLDPGLTTRIIGLANSAYFGYRDKIYTIVDAIIRVLGLNLVKNLALGIALNKPFNSKKCQHFHIDHYWYQSIETASLCAGLAPYIGRSKEQIHSVYLAGLIHNLGRLILAHSFPQQMDKILSSCSNMDEDVIINMESIEIGINEYQAITSLVKSWELPEDIICMIEYQSDPAYRGDHWKEATLIRYCSNVSNLMYHNPEVIFENEDLIEDINIKELKKERILKEISKLCMQDKKNRTMAQSLAE